MAIITQRGTVDLIPEYNRALRPIFCVSEGDANSRVINLSVTSGGEAFTIPSGAMVYVAGKKQDNNIFTYGCSFTSNTVVFPITAQMSALDGIVLCELQIIQNGNPLGTANFVYWVEPSPIQNGTTSESDLNLFEEAISKFENFDHFYADVEAMVTEAVANMQIREGQTVIDASLTVEGAAADAKATGDIVRAFMDALVTETTPTAAIATCDDAAGGLPLKKLTANIEPTQSGTGDPSPDNVRAISGYTGVTVARTAKNLINDSIKTAQSTATVVLGQTSTSAFNVFLPKGTYTFSFGSEKNPSINYRLSTESSGAHTIVSYGNRSGRLTLTEDSHIRIWAYLSGGIVPADITWCQLEIGTTATEYEAPQIATYPVTFPTSAGTVYGGTLTLNSDGSGALTVDRGYFKPDSTSQTGTLNVGTVGNRCGVAIPGLVIPDNTANILCSCGVGDTRVNGGTQANWVVGHCALYNGSSTTYFRYIFPTTVTTVADALQYLIDRNCEITYTLPTPTTYALSSVQVATMLNGVNNVWTDAAGTLTTEYYASTGLYVEKRVNAQRNMIAGVEEAMIATKNYSVNDLLIVGNTLYKVTAAISSGAALVVGTNVTETTVAEQLLALA